MKQRLKKIETALAFRRPQRRGGGMGELYRIISEEPETLSKPFQQLLKESEITSCEDLQRRIDAGLPVEKLSYAELLAVVGTADMSDEIDCQSLTDAELDHIINHGTLPQEAKP